MLKDSTIKIRKALSDEGKDIEKIHREVFYKDTDGEEGISHSIFSSPNISRYISALILESLHQQGCEENIFLVAQFRSALVGYLHIRALDNILHINNIAVAPEFQGKGIGKSLFEHLQNYIYYFKAERLTLDVDESNKVAFQWYRNLGFEIKYHTYNYCISIENFQLQECSFKVVNWLDSEAWQQTFGFSRISLLINNSEIIKIGRLLDNYWRVDDYEYIMKYPGLTYALKVIDRNRNYLLVYSKNPTYLNSTSQKKVVFRMEKLLAPKSKSSKIYPKNHEKEVS